MVLISDGYSKKGAHSWNALGCLISLRHLMESSEKPILFSQKRPICVRSMFWITI